MKLKIFTFVLAFTAVFSLQAQDKISNAGFEKWEKIDPMLPNEIPSGWFTSDILNLLLGAATPTNGVLKTTDKKSGSYAVLLKPDTTSIGLVGGIPISVTLEAFILSIDLATGDRGFYITKRPAAVTGSYKFINPEKDTAYALTTVTSWDKTKNEAIEVGVLNKLFTPAATYTTFSFPITYDPLKKSLKADTLFVGFSVGASKPSIKTQLFLDDLGLTYPVGTNEVENTPITVFPNPVMAYVYLDVATIPSAQTVILRNLEGKIVKEIEIDEHLIKIPMMDFTNGIYIYQVLDKQKNQLSVGKIDKK